VTAQGQTLQIQEIPMTVHLSQRAIEQLADAPSPVQKTFIKQINFLVRNLNHAESSMSVDVMIVIRARSPRPVKSPGLQNVLAAKAYGAIVQNLRAQTHLRVDRERVAGGVLHL
jgi:hypothetical protein